MPRLSGLGQQRTLRVEYDGETINVVFRPAAVNDGWMERLEGLPRSDRQGYMELLCETITSWDILDDEGQPLAPTVELMRQLPLDLLYQISWDILASLSPKRRSGGHSAAG